MSTIKADNIATLAGVSTSMANAVNGSAKAWVNFNGTGTVAIRRAFNVSSITDNGTGLYTVNFTTAMPDAFFATNVTAGFTADTGRYGESITPTTTSIQVGVRNSSGTSVDNSGVYATIFS